MRYALAIVFSLACASAFAQSCDQKFVGTWSVTLRTGQTYIGHHLPNRTVKSDCVGCDAVGTWTCQGNTMTKLVNGITIHGTLSADEKTITEDWGMSGATLTRVGGAGTRQSSNSNPCPNDALTYIRIVEKRANTYSLINSCAEREINVNFTSTDAFPLCTQTNANLNVKAGLSLSVNSYCHKAPEITSARFLSATAQ